MVFVQFHTVRMKKIVAIAMGVFLLSIFTAFQAFGEVRGPYEVSDRKENRQLLMELVSAERERGRHEILLEGKDYVPESLVIAQVFPQARNISNTRLETDLRDGHIYTVCRIGYEWSAIADACSHRWTAVYEEAPSCLTNGRRTVECERCGERVDAAIPALGHEDLGGDSVCDACGQRFVEQEKGDVITVFYERPGKRYEFSFVCVQQDDGGKARYVSEADLGRIFRTAGLELRTEEEVRRWLAMDFKNYLSVGSACHKIGLAREDGSSIEAGDWRQEDKIRPSLFLEQPTAWRKAEPVFWQIGDAQIRTFGDHVFLFRCIDEDYSDSNLNHQKSALFLCDTVIRSDIGSSDSQIGFLQFGPSNNYKTSVMRRWLKAQTGASEGILKTYTGVNAAYEGKTEIGAYSAFTGNRLIQREIPFQLMEDELFFLSVEEAVLYREYLWRFHGSVTENPEAVTSPYSRGYWLRTPAYAAGTDGRFNYGIREYMVELTDGNIRTRDISDGSVGMRPAFCLPQA